MNIPAGRQVGSTTLALATADSPTRERVLRVVSEHGPMTTAAITDHLGLTETAVRRHVDNLLADGLIEAHDHRAGPRRRGRPAKTWVLSESGHRSLAEDYDTLAEDAIRFIAEVGGRDAVRRFADQRARKLTEQLQPGVDRAGRDPSRRADEVVRGLSRAGFAASARPMPGRHHLAGVQLCQGHCPVQHVAAEFPELCDAETEALSELLGIHVQRLSTLANGAHVCTTFIPASAPETGSGPARHHEESR